MKFTSPNGVSPAAKIDVDCEMLFRAQCLDAVKYQKTRIRALVTRKLGNAVQVRLPSSCSQPANPSRTIDLSPYDHCTSARANTTSRPAIARIRKPLTRPPPYPRTPVTHTHTMPTPESAAFKAQKPSVPPTFDGVDYDDNKALKAAQDAVIREQWVQSMMARLIGQEMGKCYYREGVNHLEKCAHLKGEWSSRSAGETVYELCGGG